MQRVQGAGAGEKPAQRKAGGPAEESGGQEKGSETARGGWGERTAKRDRGPGRKTLRTRGHCPAGVLGSSKEQGMFSTISHAGQLFQFLYPSAVQSPVLGLSPETFLNSLLQDRAEGLPWSHMRPRSISPPGTLSTRPASLHVFSQMHCLPFRENSPHPASWPATPPQDLLKICPHYLLQELNFLCRVRAFHFLPTSNAQEALGTPSPAPMPRLLMAKKEVGHLS